MTTVANGAITVGFVEVMFFITMFVTSRIRTVRIIYSTGEEELHS